jgi:hypothetical protein
LGRARVSPLFELEKLDQSETIVTDSVDPSKGVPLRDTSSLWYIRMRDYIQNTVFSGSDTVSYDRLMSNGYMRNDLRVFPLDDLAHSYVTEDVLVPGASVCVSGLWDATTFSLVPGILTKVRIISGDRDKVLEIVRKERNSALMAGLVFLLSFVVFGME